MKYQHLFGPIPSRRLGVSLGVDLVYHKVCNLDCVYCECGKTTEKVMGRKEYVPFEAVKRELAHYFANFPEPDAVTFSGSGEPTLHEDIGRVIDFIKQEKPDVRVVVLTNSTLLSDPVVRRNLLKADTVMPSLDAVFEKSFLKINRPCKELDCKGMIDGLIAFSREFTGELNLEIFILPGINDSDEELLGFQQVIDKVQPSLIQLNTLDRPGTVKNIVPATREELLRVERILNRDNIQLIAKVANIISDSDDKKKGDAAKKQKSPQLSTEQLSDIILETIHRRPCTAEDLSMTLRQDQLRIEQLLAGFLEKGLIESSVRSRGTFYQTRK